MKRLVFRVLLGSLLALIIGKVLVDLFSGPMLKPDVDGNINHPIYGNYPETVPFEQGMTLRPGQRTIIGRIIVPLETLPGVTESKEDFGPIWEDVSPKPPLPNFGRWKPGHRFALTKDGWRLQKGNCIQPDAPSNCMD